MKNLNRLLRNGTLVAASILMATAARAATENFQATLKASSEVPPKNGPGTGTLTATLDRSTGAFKYHVEFSGLTGPVVAAHFHGPAAAGANAKPQVPVAGSPIASPIDGTATLTPDQVKELEDGKWYFNLHTKANPGGEIRGQVEKAQ